MCGIFGAVGDATDAMNRSAIAALRRRGPDSDGAFLDGNVGLAHTRLKVIDLSDLAAQPMAGCSGAMRVTFNGEIYNHLSLRAELEARGHAFRSRSDTEVIVHGYEEWGTGVVERLDGMFALGLWDAGRRRLVLARDRSGKKPLYYALGAGGGSLHFASEIKALVAAGHPAALDPTALPMLLAYGYVPAPGTIYAGIRTLPPASRLVFDIGRAEPVVDEYWQPTFLDPPLVVSMADARARVRELVVAAVQRRLEADVPLGAFLSGGLDSTIIVGVMARLLGQRVKTFSIGFSDDAAYDETAYAREAARAFGTDHTEFVVEPSSFELIEHLVELHDGPFADSSAVPTWTVAKCTREHVTVALTGDGGDELFAGYVRFLAAEAAEHIPVPLRAGAARLGQLLPRSLGERTLAGRARRFFSSSALPLPDRVAVWSNLFGGPDDLTGERGILSPALAESLGSEAPRRYQRGFFVDGGRVPPPSTLARLLEHNFRTYLAYDLQTKLDRTTAGVGLEARSPFLDTALMEYAGRLPDGMKRRGPRTKHILREAFADLVPPSIMDRKKMGFAMPLATWFRKQLREPLRDLLGPTAKIHALLRRSTVESLLARHDAGEDLSGRLFLLFTLEVWLRGLGTLAPSLPASLAATTARATASA